MGLQDHFPTNHGFQKYFGVPLSCDMGISAWEYYNESHPPFQPTPLPLFEDSDIVEQPTNLATLTQVCGYKQ